MATILITGGTGLIGEALTKKLLEKNYEVIILSRSPEKHSSHPSLSYANWDLEKNFIDIEAIQKADGIIHLAGANVGEKRWTKKRKKEIIESRTKSSGLLVTALKENSNKVKTIVSASAIGWYGPHNTSVKKAFSENDSAADDFLGTTCKTWEESIDPVKQLGKRLVKLRTGIVLSKDSEVIKKFKTPIKLGVAPILGSGSQVMSWIHITDLVNLYVMAIENEKWKGVYNAVAPNPVTNKLFVQELAKKMKGKFFIPVHIPSFFLKIMLGELSIEVLKSASVSCEKILQMGFTFLYPTYSSALRQMMA